MLKSLPRNTGSSSLVLRVYSNTHPLSYPSIYSGLNKIRLIVKGCSATQYAVDQFGFLLATLLLQMPHVSAVSSKASSILEFPFLCPPDYLPVPSII